MPQKHAVDVEVAHMLMVSVQIFLVICGKTRSGKAVRFMKVNNYASWMEAMELAGVHIWRVLFQASLSMGWVQTMYAAAAEGET